MSKHKRSNRKLLSQQNPEQDQTQTPKHFSKWKWLGEISAFGIGLLTNISTYYSFQPKIIVYSGTPLNLVEPISTPFIIESQSFLPIYDLT